MLSTLLERQWSPYNRLKSRPNSSEHLYLQANISCFFERMWFSMHAGEQSGSGNQIRLKSKRLEFTGPVGAAADSYIIHGAEARDFGQFRRRANHHQPL